MSQEIRMTTTGLSSGMQGIWMWITLCCYHDSIRAPSSVMQGIRMLITLCCYHDSIRAPSSRMLITLCCYHDPTRGPSANHIVLFAWLHKRSIICNARNKNVSHTTVHKNVTASFYCIVMGWLFQFLKNRLWYQTNWKKKNLAIRCLRNYNAVSKLKKNTLYSFHYIL